MVSEETKKKISLIHLGKKDSLETKLKKSKSQKERIERENIDMGQWTRGTTLSEETKKKISESKTGKKHRLIKCPHCDKIGGENNMKRWHFENCKWIKNKK